MVIIVESMWARAVTNSPVPLLLTWDSNIQTYMASNMGCRCLAPCSACPVLPDSRSADGFLTSNLWVLSLKPFKKRCTQISGRAERAEIACDAHLRSDRHSYGCPLFDYVLLLQLEEIVSICDDTETWSLMRTVCFFCVFVGVCFLFLFKYFICF